MAGDGAASIRPAKGVHLTVAADKVPTDVALVLAVPADGRSIFVVPWAGTGRVYIGTTDTDYDGPLDEPMCTATDVAYLLDAVNAALTTGLRADDVLGTWAGLRPLVAGAPNQRSADLSRRHRVSRSSDGVVTISGGKLTTYRAMAEDTVDAVEVALGRSHTRSRTAALALRGAIAPVDHLTGRYGTDARVVRALVAGDPSLGQPLVPSLPYLRAEAVYAARYEMARTLDDVLARRTRALVLDRDASVAAAGDVARLLAPELGWDDDEVARQVDAYRTAAEVERRAAILGARERRSPGRAGRCPARRARGGGRDRRRPGHHVAHRPQRQSPALHRPAGRTGRGRSGGRPPPAPDAPHPWHPRRPGRLRRPRRRHHGPPAGAGPGAGRPGADRLQRIDGRPRPASSGATWLSARLGRSA